MNIGSNTMVKTLLIIGLFNLIITIAFGQEQPVIRYEGSSTIAHFIRDAEGVYNKAQFEINSESESSGGEKAIVEGTADIAGVARVPSSQVLGKGLVSTLIGWDAIAVVVNSSNPVSNLTVEQLKGIFTGRITNWNQLGGPDLRIDPYMVEERSATRKVFRAAILNKQDYEGCEVVVPDNEILNKVANNNGGIGQISFSFLSKTNAQLKILSVDGQEASVTNPSYPITRPLYLLWWPGRESTAAFAEWTQSAQGQNLITNRFIGKVQQTFDKTGKLIVYTNTYAVEEGGAYYYPHEPYDIYTADGQLLKHVENHLEATDEDPTILDLKPGQYLIWTETSERADAEKLLVTIEAGETTRITVDDGKRLFEVTEKPKPILSNKLRLYGDFRFRSEYDWNSRRSDGTYRDDRGRLRYRLRFGFNYKLNENIAFGGRLRSGNTQNPQSPHVTLGEDLSENGISIDKAYLKGNFGRWWAWTGKNSLPFWKQNEMWWDDDITPEGIAMGADLPLNGSISIKPSTGYFVMYSMGQNIGTHPAMIAGQLTMHLEGKKTELTLSSGYYDLSELPDKNDLAGIHKLDYSLFISGVELQLKNKFPITIGIDHIRNLSDYNNDTLITSIGHENETNGTVGSVKFGSLNEKNKILIAYYYSHVSKYAVVPYLAQDDWVRWSYNSTPEARSSNFKGHEIRIAYAIEKGFNVVARAYFAQEIKKDSSIELELETASRIRLDLNLNF